MHYEGIEIGGDLIPVCANCNRIRDKSGQWHDIRAVILDHATYEFTHGICPDCAKKLYPEFYRSRAPILASPANA